MRASLRLLGLSLLVGVSVPSIAHTSSASDQSRAAREQYLRERAVCLSGDSIEPRDTCLREAAAAYAEARRGNLGNEDPGQLAANALARCDVRPADQRSMCERMVRGEGTVTGSVRDGGFVREIVVPDRKVEPAGAK
ncbi:MAG: hypothetical protein ACM3PU_14815 [Gemmatimonadota bacterium]